MTEKQHLSYAPPGSSNPEDLLFKTKKIIMIAGL